VANGCMKGMMNHDRRRRTISIGQDGPFRTPDLGWLRTRKAAKTAGEGTAKGGCSESLATTPRRVGWGQTVALDGKEWCSLCCCDSNK
jgi:hypothetical protein